MEGERVALSLRVTPATKRLVDDEAAKSGRSQSQQCELLIEDGLKLASQVKELNRMLDGLTLRQARQGRVIAGWLSDELRTRGLDEANITELADLIRAYFGREP